MALGSAFRTPARYALIAFLAALPAVLVYSSVRAFRDMSGQKEVYLRNRAASIAGRLETLPPGVSMEALFESLREEEPALIDVHIYSNPSDSSGDLDALWSGRELFQTGFVRAGGEEVYRTYIPFHSAEGLRIARIDLAGSGADFLTLHARHNVIISSVSGIALALLAIYAVWSAHRAANLQRRQLTLEHLAHLGQMASSLAHEIRNPLGTMKGFAQLAAERTGEEIQPLLAPVVSEAQRLERLVNDLLLYGRTPVAAVRRSEWPQIQNMLEADVRELTSGRSIAFQVESTVEALYTDPDLVRTILLNLVRNAVEAIGDQPGKIRVEARERGPRVIEISVTDDGPGISREARARLFEAFFTTKAAGTGLGLAIAKKCAGALGGELEIRDVQPHGAVAILRVRQS